MSQLLPIVEELADCETDAERAAWLLRVPAGVIFRDCAAIRRVLTEAHFRLGVDALDVEFAAINATRLPDGGLPQTVVLGLHAVRSFLRDIVRKGGGR
ncbi:MULTISPECIES: hypothetical protein [Rhizobium]|uniref:Uncharacterized protein n=1 Tax=Rhizobium paranaense TaxID=1650438 RepID=A0A7W9D3X6_9HYPH|nr:MULTISPECIES: hypothetical protein [Rhizobium]MBB5576366.1 hypothetical protein [Rhizobium paranaense]PST62593.1 hypothetical protein C9E91_13720 [Rhizobium sp. SEMIA4064]